MLRLTETRKVRYWFTKCLHKQNSWYCWYNLDNIITKKGLEELTKYVQERPQINDCIVVTNIEMTRPQRTWGCLPSWFRPDGQRNTFNEYGYNNSFVFLTWNNGEEICNYTNEELRDLLESLPTKSQIIIIKGENLYNE